MFKNNNGHFTQHTEFQSPPDLPKNSRFGFVIANLGDVDGNGHEDFVVGAPSMGSVFVYYSDVNFKFGNHEIQSNSAKFIHVQ